MNPMTVIQVTTPAEEAVWDRYVSEHPLSSGYHQMAWRKVIATCFGHQTFYYMAKEDGGEIRGILPLIFLASPMFGRFLVSVPYFNYGGLVADSQEAATALLGAAQGCAGHLRAAHIELRHVAGVELPWPKKDHKVSMRLELPQRFDDLMKSFTPKLRSQVRRGEKEGMIARTGGMELLDDFYKVFARNMRDLGTPVYEKNFFGEMLRMFPKEARLCCIYLQDQVLAGGFLYGFKHTVEIPWASSDRRYARMAPNMMLYGAVLKYACEQGYRIFDFGRSSKESGTYRFKEQWGAKPIQLHWYYWLQSGERLPELNPQNQKYRLAIEAWKRMPLGLTTWIGPYLAKYLP